MDKEHFLKRILFNKPTAFEQYNYDSLPATFLATDLIPIECCKHGLFHQKACSHLLGSGCSKCWQEQRGDKRANTPEEFISQSKSKFGDRFDYTNTRYVRGSDEVSLRCALHGDISIKPKDHLSYKFGCGKCGDEVTRALRGRAVLKRAVKLHEGKYDYSRFVFKNVNEKVEIVCPEHGSFWQDLYSHTAKATGCPVCARNNGRLTLSDFISKSKVQHGDGYEYDKVIYVDNTSMVTITCKKHGDFTQRAASHLAGCGCKKCFTESSRLSTEAFVKKAKDVHGDTYDYSRVDYKGRAKHVEIICRKHGSFWQRAETHWAGNGCQLCQESRGEKAVELVLKKYGIEHVREYRIVPHRYRYDFYLPGLDIYIEFHGQQHYRPVPIFGGEEAHLQCKERDEVKKDLVRETGGKLIVLTYLNLSDGSVEKELIRRLKHAYRYWLVVDGKLAVYRTALDVHKAFTLHPHLELKHVLREVEKKVTSLRVLF